MCRKFTADELNTMDNETKNDVIYQMQDRLDRLEHDYENLMEQVRLASQQRFGRHTEKLDEIAGRFPSSTKRKRDLMNRYRNRPLTTLLIML